MEAENRSKTKSKRTPKQTKLESTHEGTYTSRSKAAHKASRENKDNKERKPIGHAHHNQPCDADTRRHMYSHTPRSSKKSSTGRTSTSWGLEVVRAETTPHGWSLITTRTRQPAGPHTNGPHVENPPASRRHCNVATCKSRNHVIISTEVRTIPLFQKVPQ